MAKKNITTEDLARMVQGGFSDADKKMDAIKDEVGKRFVKLTFEMNQRFDQTEKILLEDHHQRIERLEGQVKELQADYRNLLGMKK